MPVTPGARASTVTAQGLVLSLRNVGESDRVLDVLLRGRGRADVWQKRARGAARGGAQALAPFASVRLLLRPRSEGFSCAGHDELSPRAELRRRLSSLRRAGQLTRLCAALWPQAELADRALDTLEVALDHLAAGRGARSAGAYPRLLWAAGLLPSVSDCHRCRRPLPPAQARVDEAGLACGRCRPQGKPLSANVLRALAGERVVDEAVAGALEQAVVQWASWHAGVPLALHL